jgi:hypothetical protein
MQQVLKTEKLRAIFDLMASTPEHPHPHPICICKETEIPVVQREEAFEPRHLMKVVGRLTEVSKTLSVSISYIEIVKICSLCVSLQRSLREK